MKKCPYCAKSIKDDSISWIQCDHCGEYFPDKDDGFINNVCIFLIDAIGTKPNKELHANLLGQFLFVFYPEYDPYINEVIRKIHTTKYKILMLGAFLAHYYEKYDHGQCEDLIAEVVTKKQFEDSDLNLAISNTYVAIHAFKKWTIEQTVKMMITAGIYAKKISKLEDKKVTVTNIIHIIEKTRNLDKVIYLILQLQDVGFDDIDERIYVINDKPEKTNEYAELYSYEACKEVGFRAHLDWFIWSHLAQEVPSMKTKPKLHFEYILNISRCSNYNKKIKDEFLHVYFEYIATLPVEEKEDLVLSLIKINDGFKHSESWKDRITSNLKNL